MNQLSQNQATAPRKRGRPSRQTEVDIDNAITQTALRLFLDAGYGATSMKRIAQQAGVSPSTLYARFADKEMLFQAVVEFEVTSLKASHPVRRPKLGASLLDIVESSAANMMSAMERQNVDAFGRLLANEAGRFPQLARIYHGATNIGQAELIEWMVAAHDSELTLQTAKDLARTLLEAVAGWSQLKIFTTPSQRGSLRSEARRIAQVIARGWAS
jgi:AcrR family transcriptional regulator